MTTTIKHKTAAAVQGQTVEEESEVAVLEEMTPMKRRELMVAINICTQPAEVAGTGQQQEPRSRPQQQRR